MALDQRLRRAEPTMRDVAVLARVSVKTVSRVLNEEPGAGPAVIGRVRAAAEQLGYRRNMSASSLRRTDRRSGALGVLLEDLSNPFDAGLLRAIEDCASEQGLVVLAGSNKVDPVRQEELLDSLAARRVDGLVVMPLEGHQDVLQRERHRGMPMVVVDRPATFADTDSVTTTNRDSSRDAVVQLATLGHRSIAHVGHRQGLWTSAERYSGYVEGLASCGLRLDPALVRWASSGVEASEQATGELLDRADPPTALFTTQNQVTVGAIRALRARGLQHRVALIGFGDFPLADLVEPAVTVVRQDIPQLGRTAADLLLTRIGQSPAAAVHAVVPATFIRRGSGELPPPEAAGGRGAD